MGVRRPIRPLIVAQKGEAILVFADDGEPRPFLKWAGGKRQLLFELIPRALRARPFTAYHEPFLGGGALFFALYRKGLLDGVPVYLSDINEELMNTYRVVRDDVQGLIARLEEHKAKHSKTYYYEVRAQVPASPLERAARTIYLNKTCFNGLYRVNSKGLFNVPIGRYSNPRIVDRRNLEAVSRALAGVEIRAVPFEHVLEQAHAGSFVYFDPPYHPMSRTSNFTSYAREGFGVRDQERLAEVVKTLAGRGVKVLLSNSSTELVKALYKGYRIELVLATRNINSRTSGRGWVGEALVTTF